ncbi:MAG: hypothetical protein ABSH44_17670 [Bryobacteraceae bacterium]|jgi:hypothetical protein
MSNTPVLDCDFCNTSAGRQGCPIHRSWTYPTLDAGLPGLDRQAASHKVCLSPEAIGELTAEIRRFRDRERELLEVNNLELERRRRAERERDNMRAIWERAWKTGLEERVAEWIRTRIGEPNLHHKERAMRLLEEALELAQAEGITIDQVGWQVDHVFARVKGEPAQEAAGVAVCLLGWCAATGNNLLALAIQEIERIEAKPLDEIRGSLARKADADLVTCLPRKHQPEVAP